MKKKKLSNLVPDIYALLDSLTEGNELNISEKTYEEADKNNRKWYHVGEYDDK